MKLLFFIGILLMALLFPTRGQDNKTAVISGILLDQKTQEPLKYAQIVSYKEGVSHTIDNKGHFFFYLGRNDSVKIVSMGYKPVVMTTRDFLATKGPDSIFMKPANYELNEVTVRARDRSVHLNLPDNIGKDVDPEAEPDRSIPEPSIGMISSPVTLAYSAFSRKAANQRRAKKQMQKQKERALWENILHSGLLETWVELEGEELEDFIVFCNKRIQVSKEDTYLSIEKKVKNILNIYQAKKE